MELEQLHQLDVIARTGTLSAAADELHISQPALSRSMQRLEADLGCPLFDRTPNRVRLNAAGRLAVDHARVVLREARRLRDAVDAAARRPRPLRVATCAPAPLWALTHTLVETLPEATLESVTCPDGQAVSGVMNGLFDIGIVRTPSLLPALASVRVMAENLSVSVPADDPLAGRDYGALSELDGRSFLLFEDIGFWRELVERAMPHTDFVIQRDRAVFAQLMRTARQLYFVTDATPASERVPGRVDVPLSDAGAHVTFYALARTDAEAPVRQVMRALRETGTQGR